MSLDLLAALAVRNPLARKRFYELYNPVCGSGHWGGVGGWGWQKGKNWNLHQTPLGGSTPSQYKLQAAFSIELTWVGFLGSGVLGISGCQSPRKLHSKGQNLTFKTNPFGWTRGPVRAGLSLSHGRGSLQSGSVSSR